MHVPGWHEATKELQEQGKLQMVGIIQEQHPDRARLFMQWKQMGWPILVDSLNLLQVPYVPITLAIDEYGIVRQVGLRVRAAEGIEETFLSKTYPKPETPLPPREAVLDLQALADKPKQSPTAEAWSRQAEGQHLWGKGANIDHAIDAYEQALRLEPGNGWTRFRLGVAYRQRYDSDSRQPGDFQKAVEHWSAALDTDPNQYIWRRRIQQYGPRLDKPYPFYDWVKAARGEVQARGERPAPLRVEPGGAEFTRPARKFTATSAVRDEPDPKGRILRDEGRFIQVETIVVPDTTSEGTSARVHVVFRPNLANKAHWNNEVDDLLFWTNPPDGWLVDSRVLTVANAPQPVSQETRKVEFELRSAERIRTGSVTIPAYGLYYVCEDVNGICMYRRQDVRIKVEAAAPQP